MGSLRVEPLIFRLVCKNGLICKDYSQKKYHIGKQVNLSEDSAYEIYSDETLAQDDKAFFMKVQDIVRAAVDENKFLLTVNKLRETKQIPLTQQPLKSVEVLAEKFILSESERTDIFSLLVRSSDNTRYCDLLETTDIKKLRKNKLSSKRFFKRIGTEPENRTVRTNRVVVAFDVRKYGAESLRTGRKLLMKNAFTLQTTEEIFGNSIIIGIATT